MELLLEIIIYIEQMWQLAIDGQKQGIWFWAALYILIVCTYSLIFQIRTRYWPFTYGTLVEFGIEQFGSSEYVKSEQDFVSKALYHYNVAGVTFEGTRVSPWVMVASYNARLLLKKQMSSVERTPDGKVKVFYNPKNPKKSYLIVAGKAGICITSVIAILPMVLFYIEYYL